MASQTRLVNNTVNSQWANPDNAFTDNDLCTSTSTDADVNTYDFTNDPFTIPAGATIDGLYGLFRWGGDGGDIFQIWLKDVLGVSRGYQGAPTVHGCADAVLATAGGVADLWGGTWTPAHINSADFQCWIRYYATAKANTMYIDFVEITVYYTPGVTDDSADLLGKIDVVPPSPGSAELLGRVEVRHSVPPPWLDAWGYRKKLIITGSADGVLTDYQIGVKVYYGPGADGTELAKGTTFGKVYCDSKCRTDFGDIRFTDENKETELDYWIEEKTDSNSAIFWVKIPSIPEGPATTSIYIYYGQPDETTTSDGDATFIIFDDFDGSSLDATKWDEALGDATRVVEDGKLKVAIGSTVYTIGSKIAYDFPDNVEVMSYIDINGMATSLLLTVRWRFLDRNVVLAALGGGWYAEGDYDRRIYGVAASWWAGVDRGAALGESRHGIATRSDDYIDWFCEGVKNFDDTQTVTDNFPMGSDRYLQYYLNSPTAIDVDLFWIALRKMTINEPEPTSWGSEEPLFFPTDLLGYFEIQDSADLFAKFVVEVGLIAGSADLLAEFVVAQDSADLFAECTIRQESSADLVNKFAIRHTDFVDLLGKAKITRADSSELLCKGVVRNLATRALLSRFEVGQNSADLLAEFSVRPSMDLYLRSDADKGEVSVSENLVLISAEDRRLSSASADLLAEFVVAQDSADLLGYFISGAILSGSADLLGEFEVRRDDLAELYGQFIIKQSAFTELLGYFDGQATEALLSEFIVRYSTIVNLASEFIVRHPDLTELPGEFIVSQPGSVELFAEFIVRHDSLADLFSELIVSHPDYAELLGKFISRQADSVELFGRFEGQTTENLPAEFIVRHDSLVELPGEFIIRHADSVEFLGGFDGQVTEDLPAEFIARQSDFEDLLGQFIVQYDGFAELVGHFEGQASLNLSSKLIVRYSAWVKLSGEFITRHKDDEDLPGGFIPRRSASVELHGQFISRQADSVELLGKYIIRHTDFAELLGSFDGQATRSLFAVFVSRPPYPFWTNRRWVNGVIELSEAGIPDAFLEGIIVSVMDDVKTWLIANEVGQYSSWIDISKTPMAIRRATTYGVVASLYARNVFGPRARYVVKAAPVDVKVLTTNETAMEYWEGMMIRVLEFYLSAQDLDRLWIDTLREDPVFSMEDIPLYTWSPDDYTTTSR